MIDAFIAFANTFPPELPLLALFLFSSMIMFVMARFFGQPGLYVYGVLAIIIGNIQVLKGVQLNFLQDPVALGTIIFSSSFVTTDTLTECFGPRAARRAIGLGFTASFFISISMLLTLGTTPLDVLPSNENFHFVTAHNAMKVLFTPSVAIFAASVISYIASQLLDIAIFQKLRQASNTFGLWMRSGVSTAIAFLIDNTIFSIFAWVIFSSEPISMHSLMWTYIFGTYILRLITMVAYMPIVYAMCNTIKKRHVPIH